MRKLFLILYHYSVPQQIRTWLLIRKVKREYNSEIDRQGRETVLEYKNKFKI